MQKVISKDGTPIAYDRTGSGPAVIMIDGAFCRRGFGPMLKLAPFLSGSHTVICYDRRGRGDSGDTAPYAVEREIEDLEALIREAGGSASLFGISSGAVLALRAVASGLKVTKLAMYEPPFMIDCAGHMPPPDALQRLKAMIAAGERGAAARYYLTKVIGVPVFFYYIMRMLPMWSNMRDIANSLPYDAEVMGDFSLLSGPIAAIRIPAMAIGGEKSPKMLHTSVKAVAETLPGAQLKMLKGQTHNVSAAALGPVLNGFFA